MARRTPDVEPEPRHAAIKAVGWAVIALLWALTALALISHDAADAPSHAVGLTNVKAHNWVGSIGATVSHEAYLVLGPGVWILMAALGAWLGLTAANRKPDQPTIRVAGVLMMTAACSGLAAVGQSSFVTGYGGAPEGPGGLLGLFLHDELVPRFASLGALLILAAVFWVGSVLAADQWVLAVPKWMGEGLLRLLDLSRDRWPGLPHLPTVAFAMPKLSLRGLGRRGAVRANDVDDDVIEAPASGAVGRKRRRGDRGEADADAIDESAGGYGATGPIATRPTRATEKVANAGGRYDRAGDQQEAEEAIENAPAAYLEAKDSRRFDPDALKAKMAQMPINFAPKTASKEPPARAEDFSGYRFPGMDLLEEPEGEFTTQMEFVVRDQAVQLESALREYRIEGEVVGIDSGPVITLFEVRLAPGTKVSRISAVDSDIARALRAPNIRIVPNMAGKDTVGIEVPNIEKERVRLKELMSHDPEKLQKMKLPMFLGKDASGNPLVADLGAMPHMLIAGTTGSGKSVCMNSIIMSFLYTKRPDEMKLVLVDPKMVEMSQFKSIPHLMCPVVTEMSKAAAILEWAVTKMDERYELLAEAGVRDIASYNQLGWDEIRERMEPATPEEEAHIPRKLPYLVFIIDELADLMMTNKEVEAHIVRIAQKARAVGMHLILATQRPQANVVTGLIKSNMPCRICMKVSSGMDSRIVLDSKGGELLLGHGDMLFLSPRSSELTRAQGTLVDDHEIRKTVRFLKEVAQQAFEPQLVQIRSSEAAADGEGFGQRDELFDKAVEVVLDTQRGSVSLLQRRLTIGYSRASRIIEEMERFGIIGGHKTAQAREVLISPEEWAAMIQLAEQEAAASTGDQAHAATPAGAGVEPETDDQDDDQDDDDDAGYEEIDQDGDAEYDQDPDEEQDARELDEYEYEDEDGNPCDADGNPLQVAELDGEWEEAEEEDADDAK